MTFTWPFWLLLLIPSIGLLWWRRSLLRALTPLRLITFLLLLLAISGLSLRLPSRSGCVVVVADRSLSMPPGSKTDQQEIMGLLYRAMGRDDVLGVVSFGERVSIDQIPQRTMFPGFVSSVGDEASNLEEAVTRAVSLIPRERPGRILVLSDGRATGKDVAAAATRAASAGIAIDYRSIQRAATGDLAIQQVDAPSSVAASEAFMISAWVVSPRAEEVSYELRRGEKLISSGRRNLPEGRSRLLFRDQAAEAGSSSYSLQIRSTDSKVADPVTENNFARFLVGVRGAKPLLCVGAAESGLPDLLKAGGLQVERRTPGQMRWTLAELSGFAGVLLENTPAGKINSRGMETLSAWVTEAGGGLMVTGGMQSFGAGGYFKSALDPILPVSMELRREHRKLSLAIVVALDRSGSMAVPVAGGRTKMDLANVATAEVLNQLSGSDQFGCLAVDSAAHEIVPLTDLTNKSDIEKKILKIDSMGGGIFVYEALEKAAAMISTATAGTKHIILFSDAADSEEPGNYVDLVKKMMDAGITVSVIGLGTNSDVDAGLLQDIAKLGGGQCMFTLDAHELPRLFAQDTFLVSRSTFIEDPTNVRPTAGMMMVSSNSWGEVPAVGGYNLCYLRPGANLAAVTVDDYQAPLVSSWQAGTGRVLCYTGEADGEHTGPIGQWGQAGEFFTSLGRWVSTQDQGLGPDLLLTQEIQNGVCRFKLHLDSERESTPFSALPQLRLLRGHESERPESVLLPLNWTSADVLSAEVPVFGRETLLASLDLPGIGRTTLPPICLPYSAEFEPEQAGSGMLTLERMARASGGIERVNLASIWSDLPRIPRFYSLAPWLLLTALAVLLLDILQQRTGITLFSRSLRKQSAPPQVDSPATASPATGRVRKPVARQRPSPKGTDEKPNAPAEGIHTPPASAPPKAPSPKPAEQQESVLDALSAARNRASKRTNR